MEKPCCKSRLTFEGEEEPQVVDVTFAELLIDRVEKQQIVLENPSTSFILSRFTSGLDNGEIPSTESFFTDTTVEVQKKATDMLVSRYSLSENWEERHHIFSKRGRHSRAGFISFDNQNPPS